jgi:hypothetical protein
MKPAIKLQSLITKKEFSSAIEVCKEQIRIGVGNAYYSYWLKKLSQDNELGKEKLIIESAFKVNKKEENLLSELKIAISDSKYNFKIKKISDKDIDYLNELKLKILSNFPFKGEIYLPTNKITLVDQVAGLLKVKDLLEKENLEESKKRFNNLRKYIKASGKKRVFIVGNGPSLNQTDLKLLKNEITIGFNGIFLHDEFKPTIYIVEDHLVAEDRIEEISKYNPIVKIFPSYLGYCIPAQENTIFLNHLPRVSYPVDTDFSGNAGEVTYTGGTVTYTGLQVAASLGFEEIILIGVDASYAVHNVDRSVDYGIGVLTSKSDDINHFDPRYFGKGYRWHDPNVHTMLQAYRKAKIWADNNNISIKNATIGGQLEVFERFNYNKLFKNNEIFPKIAIIDFTHVNRLSATGLLKKNLLNDWPKSSQIHIYADEKNALKAFTAIDHDLYTDVSNNVWPAFRSLIEFDPSVLYLRPTHDRVSITILQSVAAAVLNKPILVHYMDDWLEKISNVKDLGEVYGEIFKYFVARSQYMLTICPKMSQFILNKYSKETSKVVSIHNFTHSLNFEEMGLKISNKEVKYIRYFGGLEPDMGLKTIQKIANQIEEINESKLYSVKLKFEIYTSRNYINKYSELFFDLKHTSFFEQTDNYSLYLRNLSDSDLNLICYNFDNNSVNYLRYSMANKLPEILSVNKPFLAIGSKEIGTIELLQEHGYPLLFTSENFDIKSIINFLLNPSEQSLKSYHTAIGSLKDEFSEKNNKILFHQIIRDASVGYNTSEFQINYPKESLFNLIRLEISKFKHITDLELLVRIPLISQNILNIAFAKVKSHSLDWSVSDFSNYKIKKWLDLEELYSSNDETKGIALAVLICSLGNERFSIVTNIVRKWIIKESEIN